MQFTDIISNNFTYGEMIASSHKNVDNTPNGIVIKHLTELCVSCLQKIRDFYGKGIRITSGYRCPALNKLVGGSATSAHVSGYAADTKPVDGNMREYQKAVLEWAKNNNFDQIIIEYPTGYVASWIHIGIRNSAGLQRKQIIYTTNGKNYYPITNKFYLK